MTVAIPTSKPIPSLFDMNLEICENQDRVRNVDQVTRSKKVREEDFDLNYLEIALSARGSQLNTPQTSPEKGSSYSSPDGVWWS